MLSLLFSNWVYSQENTMKLYEKHKDEMIVTESGLKYYKIISNNNLFPSEEDSIRTIYKTFTDKGLKVINNEGDVSGIKKYTKKWRYEGMGEAIRLLRYNEKLIAYIPSNLAYKDGYTANIGPNTNLILELEILSKKDAIDGISLQKDKEKKYEEERELKRKNSPKFRTDGFYLYKNFKLKYGNSNYELSETTKSVLNLDENAEFSVRFYPNTRNAVLLFNVAFASNIVYKKKNNNVNSTDLYKKWYIDNATKQLSIEKEREQNHTYKYGDYETGYWDSNNSKIFCMLMVSESLNRGTLENGNKYPENSAFQIRNDEMGMFHNFQVDDFSPNIIYNENTIIEPIFIEVPELSDNYLADRIQNEKINAENKEKERVKAENEWKIQQEKNRLAAIEFEKNRKLKLKSATVGDRICYSQDWSHTESSSGFFGFGAYESKINYKMMIVCYIEKKEGDKFQVRVANIESTNKNEYSTPDYKGVKMREESIHWINPYTDKDWLICE